MSFIPHNLYPLVSHHHNNRMMMVKKKKKKEQESSKNFPDGIEKSEGVVLHHVEEEDEDSLSLRNLSKLILPPLGVSSFNQSQINSKWIISPMDSRYRYLIIFNYLII